MPIETFVCPCPGCKAKRAQRLRDDLNAMADRRVIGQFDIPVKTEWRPDWKWIAIASAFCLLFFWGIWSIGSEIARQAGI